MRKLFFIISFLSFVVANAQIGQQPTTFSYGIRIPNMTNAALVDSIPVVTGDGQITGYITKPQLASQIGVNVNLQGVTVNGNSTDQGIVITDLASLDFVSADPPGNTSSMRVTEGDSLIIDPFGEVLLVEGRVKGNNAQESNDLVNLGQLSETLEDYEEISNKVTDFTTTDNVTYPTTQAVVDYVAGQTPPPPEWGNITGDLADQTDLQNALDAKINTSEKGAANGVATLGLDGKLPSSQVPPIAITETFVVADQAAMLALNATKGDVAVRNDEEQSYILQQEPASTLGNWVLLKSPTDESVSSVNGQTGNVQLNPSFSGGQLSITGSSAVNLDSRYYTETETDGLLSDKEDVSNKATDFTALNNTLYPTTQAVADYVLSEKPPAAVPVRKNAGVISQILMSGETLDIHETANLHYNSGASGYPTEAGGALFSSSRGNGVTFQIVGSITTSDEMFFRFGNGGEFKPWYQVASREWANSQFLTSPSNLQQVLDAGDTATGNINLSGNADITGGLNVDGITTVLDATGVNNPLTAGNLGFGLSWNNSANEIELGKTQGGTGYKYIDVDSGSVFSIGGEPTLQGARINVNKTSSGSVLTTSGTFGGYFSQSNITPTSASLYTSDGSNLKSINTNTSTSIGVQVTDQIAGVGITGSADYSANYTPLTYVQKTYVDQAEYLKLLPNYNATVEQALGHDGSGDFEWIKPITVDNLGFGLSWNSSTNKVDAVLSGIDEGNGIGYRLTSSDPDNYGNIGLGAVDLSYSTAFITSQGATGNYATTMGINNTASGRSSVAIGEQVTTSGNRSVAMGWASEANGVNSIAMGNSSFANGLGSVAIRGGVANGSSAVSIGGQANGLNSVTIGNNVIANAKYSTSIGYFNDPIIEIPEETGNALIPGSPLFIVGNGDSAGGPGPIYSNAYVLYNDGRSEQQSDVEVTTPGDGLILASPDGTRWKITIDNSGTLTTTALP